MENTHALFSQFEQHVNLKLLEHTVDYIKGLVP